MTGSVDDSGRALVRMRLKKPVGDETVLELDTWVDTGFTSEIVLPQQNVTLLDLPLGPPSWRDLRMGRIFHSTLTLAFSNGSVNGSA